MARVIIIGILAAIVVVAALFVFMQPKDSSPEPATERPQPPATDAVDNRVKAIREGCEGMKNKTACVDEELFIAAQSGLNAEYCKGIKREDLRYDCYLGAALKNAVKNENPDECNRLNEKTKTNCLDSYHRDMAELKGDERYCDNITTAELSDECHDAFIRNTTTGKNCNLLRLTRSRDECLFNLAGQKNDTTICRNITDRIMRDMCTGAFIPEGENG